MLFSSGECVVVLDEGWFLLKHVPVNNAIAAPDPIYQG
jgi:hypothetical protein